MCTYYKIFGCFESPETSGDDDFVTRKLNYKPKICFLLFSLNMNPSYKFCGAFEQNNDVGEDDSGPMSTTIDDVEIDDVAKGS